MVIEYSNTFVKSLKKLNREEIRKIVNAIDRLEKDDLRNIKKLKNFKPQYRLRVGDYRIFFEIEEEKAILYYVRHRSRAYNQ